jgi:DNA-binding NtrC family response regulator
MGCVLIIDRELGFMWALAQQLQARGIATIPSSSVREARTVLAAIQPHLSLVIVNCRCKGACSFAEQLRKRHHLLRIVAIISRGFSCRECQRSVSATLDDPEDREPERLAQCVELVRILVVHARPLQ